ncbi:hypothetical protein GTW78_22465, partial [Streptomyces sp. SID4948]|nr:hypothetical protein [Streptomyces sp. SID4948]
MTSAGSLDASSNASWSQSDVRLTAHQTLTALSVELRVAETGGVASTGSYTSIPGKTTASVRQEGGYLVYRWTLDPGETLGGRHLHLRGGSSTTRPAPATPAGTRTRWRAPVRTARS